MLLSHLGVLSSVVGFVEEKSELAGDPTTNGLGEKRDLQILLFCSSDGVLSCVGPQFNIHKHKVKPEVSLQLMH